MDLKKYRQKFIKNYILTMCCMILHDQQSYVLCHLMRLIITPLVPLGTQFSYLSYDSSNCKYCFICSFDLDTYSNAVPAVCHLHISNLNGICINQDYAIANGSAICKRNNVDNRPNNF